MPGGDGTGPRGMGPMTGRAAGYCAGFPVPGYMNPALGYGGRQPATPYGVAPYGYDALPYAARPGWFGGFGRGWGRAWGRRFGRGRGYARGRRRWFGPYARAW